VVILIDDMTRPTKSHQYLPPILETLREVGIPRDNIRFIMASGSHGPYDRLDFVKKLGEEIVAEYQTYNHNPYEYLDYIGETSRGTPLYVNAEVMNCDLKIGIGTILFHRLMGFSGGGKMIMPGVSGIKTIIHNHGEVGGFGPDRRPHPSTGYLNYRENIMRLDAEEAARMAGLDFKVDTVLNLDRDPIAVHAGDFVQAHRRAAEAALRWHRTEAPKEMDVVVANAYMRASEAVLALWPAYASVKENGTIVLIPNAPEGQVNHWVFGKHGKFIGARLSHSGRRPLMKGRRLIIYSPYKERSLDLRLGDPTRTVWLRDWEEVLEVLGSEHGPHPRVAILPDATSGIPETRIGD
jgi:nickel-dependent lactate racemase